MNLLPNLVVNDRYKIIKKIGWNEFEKLVTDILKKHDFVVLQNFRFKTDRKFEVDILASDEKNVLVIDCKHWNRGRYKKTSLRYAVEEQKYRLNELKKFVKNNPIMGSKFKINKTTKFIPLIVTWFEEDLLKHKDIFIVPIWKFNEFLLSMSEYI